MNTQQLYEGTPSKNKEIKWNERFMLNKKKEEVKTVRLTVCEMTIKIDTQMGFKWLFCNVYRITH